jgi:DNA-binding LytR/AlgR family response regulator
VIRVLIVDDEPIARRGIRQQLRGESDVEVIGESGDGAAAHDYAKRLAIKGDGRVILVDVDEIDRLEAAGNYVEVHSGARHHLAKETGGTSRGTSRAGVGEAS